MNRRHGVDEIAEVRFKLWVGQKTTARSLRVGRHSHQYLVWPQSDEGSRVVGHRETVHQNLGHRDRKITNAGAVRIAVQSQDGAGIVILGPDVRKDVADGINDSELSPGPRILAVERPGTVKLKRQLRKERLRGEGNHEVCAKLIVELPECGYQVHHSRCGGIGEIGVACVQLQGVVFEIDVDSVKSILMNDRAHAGDEVTDVSRSVERDRLRSTANRQQDLLALAVEGTDICRELGGCFRERRKADGASRSISKSDIDDVISRRHISQRYEACTIVEVMPVANLNLPVAGTGGGGGMGGGTGGGGRSGGGGGCSTGARSQIRP